MRRGVLLIGAVLMGLAGGWAWPGSAAAAGGGWGIPVTVGPASMSMDTPVIAFGRRGQAAVAWVPDLASLALAQRPRGGRFRRPNEENDLGRPAAIAFDRAGSLLIAGDYFSLEGDPDESGCCSRVRIATRGRNGRLGQIQELAKAHSVAVQLGLDSRGNALALVNSPSALRAALRPARGELFRRVRLTATREASAAALAFDRRGNTYIVAVGRDGVILMRRRHGGLFSRARTVARFGAVAGRPRSVAIASHSGRAPVVAWIADRVQWAVRRPAGGFSRPRALSGPLAGGQPILLRAYRRGVVAVWQECRATRRCRIRAAIGEGGRFGRPASLSKPGRNASQPALEVDRSGRALAAWVEGGRVRAAVRPPGGRFRKPITISNPLSQVITGVALAFGPRGEAIATWGESVPSALPDGLDGHQVAAAVYESSR